MSIHIEIAAHSIDSALAAALGGADRIELFSNPGEGGVTPSHGTISLVREGVAVALHILIRPRGGDFCYSYDEYQAMLRDIVIARELGANGVAIGVLTPDASVDVERTCKLVDAARPLAVTFHRAFDLCRELPRALEDVIVCGADRILTSGGEATAWEGVDRIADLVRRAGNRIGIVAAGAIKPENAREIVERSGVREIHAGLRSLVTGPMRYVNAKVSFGPVEEKGARLVVREEDVRRLRKELQDL